MPGQEEKQAEKKYENENAPEPGAKRKKWLFAALAVALLAVGGYFIREHYSGRETTDDAQIDGSIIPISPRVGGTVQELFVDENQQVTAGTVLFQIDPTDYQVGLERARAELEQAEAAAQGARTNVPIASKTTGSDLSMAQAGVGVAASAVTAARKEIDAAHARASAAEAQLRQAEASQKNATQDLERYRQLVEKDEISKQQFDAAVTSVSASTAAMEAAKAAVAAARQEAAAAESRLEQAQARLLQAQAEQRSAETAPERVAVTQAQAKGAEAKMRLQQAMLDQAQLNLGYTTVKAPVDGIVSKKTVEVGMNVAAGQPVLALVPLNDLWITANFKETQLENMRAGQEAAISVDTFDGHEYHGAVESIAAATGETFSLLPPENATGNFVKVVQRIPVRIRLNQGEDPRHLLRPGMSVVVTVFTR